MNRTTVRLQLIERDGYRCVCCGKSHKRGNRPLKLTIDHLIPKRVDGTDDLWNVALMCEPCNLKKAGQVIPKYVGMALNNRDKVESETESVS